MVPTKRIKRIAPALLIAGLSLCPHAYASTFTTEVNGVPYPSIVVNGNTELLWGALQKFQTPYHYEGNGKFYIAGHEVQGDIRGGQTYLPWWVVGGTPIQATRLFNGWNFTHVWSDTTDDGYKLNVILPSSTTKPGVFVPMWVQTFDDNGNPVKGNIAITEKSDNPSYGQGGATDCATPFYWPETMLDPGTETITVTWTDPKGILHTVIKTLDVHYPQSSATPVPADDQVVATTPAHFVNDQVLFDSTVNGVPIQWQLDTGAMTPTINGSDAAKLNLPHEQTITIEGVTGSGTAYVSHMDVTIGGVTFSHVLCIVYPDMQNNSLFGFSFFSDQQYDLLVSQKHSTITILK